QLLAEGQIHHVVALRVDERDARDAVFDREIDPFAHVLPLVALHPAKAGSETKNFIRRLRRLTQMEIRLTRRTQRTAEGAEKRIACGASEPRSGKICLRVLCVLRVKKSALICALPKAALSVKSVLWARCG